MFGGIWGKALDFNLKWPFYAVWNFSRLSVISNHIFTDGNKRTGLDSCLLFLDFNGYQLNHSVTDPVLTDFILSVASGDKKLEEVQEWIKINSSAT